LSFHGREVRFGAEMTLEINVYELTAPFEERLSWKQNEWKLGEIV
jgi:hypothetical protein